MRTKSIGNGWHKIISKNENEKVNKNQNNMKKNCEKKTKSKKNTQISDSYENSDEFDGSSKKILCQNIINTGECKYGNKCMYAHNLEEQNVSEIRKYAYDIIKSDIDLKNVFLSDELYKVLFLLTKYCKNCNVKNCIGGYNCKSGACDKKYVVCANDLNYGKCENPNCMNIHLTKKGLKPYHYNNNNTENKIEDKKNKFDVLETFNFKTNLKLNKKSKLDFCSETDSEVVSETDLNIDIDNNEDINSEQEYRAIEKKYCNHDLCDESIFS